MRTVTSASNIVAIDHKSLEANLPAGSCGYMVFWSLAGEVPTQALADAWTAANLDPALLPEPPSPAASFSRACNEFKSDSRLVRPVKGGFAFVRETPDKSGKVTHDVECYIYHDAGNNTFRSDPGIMDPAVVAVLESQVRGRYAHHRSHYAVNDLSLWVTGRVKACKALAMRPTGGFYFVPPAYTSTMDAMKGALASIGATLFNVTAVHNDSAAEAIIAALAAEVETMATKVTEEIDSEAVGSRALKSREDAARDLASKVEHYESVIGQSLSTITGKLSGLHHSIVVAMAKAESDAE